MASSLNLFDEFDPPALPPRWRRSVEPSPEGTGCGSIEHDWAAYEEWLDEDTNDTEEG